MKRLVLLCALVLQVWMSVAQAALPEIPANDYDDDSTGGDALIADGDDLDNDGYASDQDCDDTAWQTIPGEYYPCDAGGGANTGYRLCNSNGTWGSCTSNATPLCEATGGGSCYYINCSTGNNANAGSYASPWASAECLGYWSSGAPGCHVNPAAGSVAYYTGTGTCSTTYDPDGGGGAFTSTFFGASSGTPSGTLSNPLTIKRYPGATTKFDGPGTDASSERWAFSIQNSDHITIKDLKFETGFGRPIFASGSDYLTVIRIFVNGYHGEEDNNMAGIYANGGTNGIFTHNKIMDVTDPVDSSGDPSNIAGITIFNDDTGGDHLVAYNRIGYTNDPALGGNDQGNGIKFKHGADRATHDGNYVTGNIIWNTANYGVETFTSETIIRHNLFVNAGTCFKQAEDSDSYYQDVTFEYNTCYDSAPIATQCEGTFATCDTGQRGFDPIGPWTFRYNIFYDTKTAVGDSGGRGVRIDFYGADAQLTEVLLAGLTFESNVYYNPNLAYKWTLFGANTGDNVRSGNAGFTTTTFSTWQNGVRDLLSSVATPDFDSSLRSQDFPDWGWRSVNEAPPPIATGGGFIPFMR